jgi:small subunit ribosomal protein S1
MKTNLLNIPNKTQLSEFAKLLEEKQFTAIPKPGDVVKGHVISVTKAEVHLDIGGYRAGVIRARELYNESTEYGNLKIGDEVEATVLEIENEMGELELSFRFAGQQRSWSSLNDQMSQGQTVEAIVVDANRGGLIVRVGHTMGFLPVSQLSSENYPRIPGGDKSKILDKLKSFVGRALPVKVLDVNPQEEKLIVSEKKIDEDVQATKVNTHLVGEVVEGPITAIADFGAFLQFADGLTGLIHISELAWQRVDNPTEVVKVGDVVKAEIININGSKVFLSMKRLTPDPWKSVEDKYKVGQKVKGKIKKISSFGLFVELDPEIHGLAHISELGLTPDAVAALKSGDELDFTIVSLKPSEYRLGLSRVRTGGDNPPSETKEPIAVAETK